MGIPTKEDICTFVKKLFKLRYMRKKCLYQKQNAKFGTFLGTVAYVKRCNFVHFYAHLKNLNILIILLKCRCLGVCALFCIIMHTKQERR